MDECEPLPGTSIGLEAAAIAARRSGDRSTNEGLATHELNDIL